MNNSTPISGLSEAGREKLREMTENSNLFVDFLKFHGKVFKHNPSISLEFYIQKPETRFIATKEQWERSGRTVAAGSEAIHFADNNGGVVDMYDFSQVEESEPPYLWSVNKENAAKVKAGLGIPENMPLVQSLVSSTLSQSDVTNCMKALGIPPQQFSNFSRSYVSAVKLIIAGRLEVGGSQFNFQPDISALKMLRTESEKLTFLTYAAKAAREALMKVERTINNINAAERNDSNDLQGLDYTDRGRTGVTAGRGAAGDSAGGAAQQPDGIEDDTQGRSSRLGGNSGSEERQEHTLVSSVQDEENRELGDVVQVRPDMGSVQPEHNGKRAVNGGRADRNIRHEVDNVHGDELISFRKSLTSLKIC